MVVEVKDGSNVVATDNVELVRSGNYFRSASEVSFNIPQSKAYTVFVKTKRSIGRSFGNVMLSQSQVLDCTVSTNQNCGELSSQIDNKVLLSGDTDAFNTASGSYNKVDSADLQVLSQYFNQSAVSQASVADFNLDGAVNISDLEILGKNYGLQGN